MKKRRSVIFTDRRNSNRAIMAVIVMFSSYRSGGEVRFGYGVTAFLAAVYSVTGLVLGALTAQNKDYNKLFPVLGIFLNLAALLGVGLILYFGGKMG